MSTIPGKLVEGLFKKVLAADVSPALMAQLAEAGVNLSAPRREVFARVWKIAHDAAQLDARCLTDVDIPSRATIPYLNEPWYC